MNSIWYGEFRVDLIDDVGGRLERQPSNVRPAVIMLPRAQPVAPTTVLHGRRAQVDAAEHAIRERRPIEFYAQCGYGKSTLLRYIAATSSARLGRPGVYGYVGEDAPADVLQRLINVMYTLDRPTKLAQSDCGRLLAQADSVVVLDDVACTSAQLASLVDGLRSCGIVLGSELPQLQRSGRSGRSEELSGLSDTAALSMVRHDLGRPITQFESSAVSRLSGMVHGQPLRLRQATALVRSGEQSFVGVADLVGHDASVLDRMSLDRLTDGQRRLLATLALFGGALVPADLISVVANVGEIVAALNDLRDRALIDHRDNRFGLPVCQAKTRRADVLGYIHLGNAVREVAKWLGSHDTRSDSALSAVDAAVALVGYTAERRDWDSVVRLVRVAEPILTLAGRWESCRQLLDQGIHASHAAGATTSEALFAHQQGTLALCLGRSESAAQLLTRAVQLRERNGDPIGAEVSRHNLRQLTGPGSPSMGDMPPPLNSTPQSPRAWARLRRLTIVGSIALAILAVGATTVAGLMTTPQRPRPQAVTTANAGATATPTPLASATTEHPSGPRSSASSKGPVGARPPVIVPTRHDFVRLNISPNHPSVTHTFTITNQNRRSVTIEPAQVTGDHAYVVDQDGCALMRLESGGQCRLTVAFDPTTIGDHFGALVVSDTEGRSSSAELIGTGFAILTVTIVDAAGQPTDTLGTVKDGTGAVDCPTACEAKISTADQATITLSATTIPFSPDGSVFIGWSGGCTGSARTCQVILTQDTVVTARFAFMVG